MKLGALTFAMVITAAAAVPQPRGGILTVELVNGTTGGPGSGEKVTLYRLAGEMTPVQELGTVSGRFEITEIELEGQRPMLLQVTSSGVNYNQTIDFGRGYEAQAEITVYDAFHEWDDAVLEITTSRFLYRREGDKLLVDKVFVVENRSSPPRTYHNPDGTFRFNLPTDDLLSLHSVSASGASGMPVPQPASPIATGPGYVTKTAFKPGETQIAISYEVGYAGGHYAVDMQSFFVVPELLVFLAPPDMNIEAEGWEILGVEPQGRFSAIRKSDVAAGDPIRFELSGGSPVAPDLVPSRSGSSGAAAAPAATTGGTGGTGGTVMRLTDPTLASKWVLVILMAAALGYGLLAALFPSSTRRAD